MSDEQKSTGIRGFAITVVVLAVVHGVCLLQLGDGVALKSLLQVLAALVVYSVMVCWRYGNFNGQRPLTRSALIGLDVLLIAAALISGVPAFGVFGSFLLSVSVGMSVDDRTHKTTLLYLSWLPAAAVLPALESTVGLFASGQNLAVKAASRFLDNTGYLHVLEKGEWNLAGLSFPADAVYGQPDGFAFLVIAIGYLCYQRRRLLHILPLLCCAAGIAFALYSAQIVLVSVVWLGAEFDLSGGLTMILLRLFVFICGLSAVALVDYLLLGLTRSFRHDIGLDGRDQFITPFHLMWEQVFATIEPRSFKSWTIPLKDAVGDIKKLNRSVVRQWAGDFLKTWWKSRGWWRIQFLVVLVLAVGVFMGSGLLGSAQNAILTNYQREQGSTDSAEPSDYRLLLLTKLVQAKSTDKELRLRLIQELAMAARFDDLIPHLERLAPVNKSGYAPARMWLLDASHRYSQLAMTDDVRIQHLFLAQNEMPQNVDVCIQLSGLLEKQGNIAMAERQLITAVDIEPLYSSELIRLLTANKRMTAESRQCLENANERLEKRIRVGDKDANVIIALGKVMVALGRLEQAAELFDKVLSESDSSEFSPEAASFYRNFAVYLFNQPLSKQRSSDMAVKALNLHPEDSASIEILNELHQLGFAQTADKLQLSISYWEKRVRLEPQNTNAGRSLAKLFAVTEQYDRAVEALAAASDVPAREDLQHLIRWHRLSGNSDAADSVADQLLTEIRAERETRPEDVPLVEQYLGCLHSVDRFEEIISFGHHLSEDSELRSSGKVMFYLNESYFYLLQDKLNADDSETDGVKLLLSEFFELSPLNQRLLLTLGQVRMRDDALAEHAESLISRILASGKDTARVYSVLGYASLKANRYSESIKYLERAVSLNNSDPMILNNLAFVLARSPNEDLNRALSMSDRALSLAPDHPELLVTRGEINIRLQRWNNARKDLQRSLQIRPESDEGKELLEMATSEQVPAVTK